jgi:hypothetical protein
VSDVPLIELEVTEHHARYRYFDLTTSALLLLGFSVDVYGWSLKNPSTSTAADIDLYDTPDGTGVPALPIQIPSSTTDTKWFGPNGVRFHNALYANVTTGEVKGSIFYRHVR